MLMCGVGARRITPEGPAYLMGYATRRGKATDGSVHDDLYVKALYLAQGGQRALILSADLCELSLADCVSLRQRIAARCGVEQVLISVTHTHSAPGTFYNEVEMPHFDAAWFEQVCQRMLEAAEEAVAHPFAAAAGAAVTDVPEVGKNRRTGCSVTDPALTVIKVEDVQGTVRALLLNYACHCTILDGNSYTISADYPGYLYTQLAERYPEATVLFTNGAAGDINIGYSSDASALGEAMPFRSFETAEGMARLLSGRAAALIDGLRVDPQAALRARTVLVTYPLRQDAPDDDALAETIRRHEAVLAGGAGEAAKRAAHILMIYAQILRYNMRMVGRGETIAADSTLIRIGGALLISFPVELFCEVGLALKARLPEAGLICPVGYAGGYIGYLPTEEAMRAGGYEAETSPFAPDAGQALVEALAEAARGM